MYGFTPLHVAPLRSLACVFLRWTKLGELEAEVGRTEALYAAVTEEARVAEEEGASLTAVRTRLEREIVQIGTKRLNTIAVRRLVYARCLRVVSGQPHAREACRNADVSPRKPQPKGCRNGRSFMRKVAHIICKPRW